MDALIKLSFFIRDLDLQLEQLHEEQPANFQKSFTIFRGQGLSKKDLQSLSNSKNGLLSLNNFLSSSIKGDMAIGFVQDALHTNASTMDIIFLMTIDPNKTLTSTTRLVMFDVYSALPQEKETLFVMHDIFRVSNIKQTIKNNHLWEVQLTVTSDSDPQLAGLANRIKKDLCGSSE
ncbi:unnamed protein product [Rotaria socialis]|uniref:Uncharacterized protein n=2 Tax=Rotaria socialis TaxID=392032 RepID=A0A817YAV4_9BILA|nr:unnamed protein product [Rotaria socialis]CAF3432362.1 unnamed protein product [Rotaria socialis]CAF3437850.1 unnamed protein product [Rotaria socialis]CAF4180836.1 unnamed protein product [Rotaria socialis]CAF4364320.1 unnamed protein product [Rotaria socialis]